MAIPNPATLQKNHKKLAQSMNGLDDPNLAAAAAQAAANGDESPFNTGIYRKKGHLNERAFSYSIRQEHRSRSYGSLANLKFANGGQELEVSFLNSRHDSVSSVYQKTFDIFK